MQLLETSRSEPQTVFPTWGLLITITIALGLSYWLVPGQEELVQRLLRDQQYKRLQQTLAGVAEDIRPGDLRALPREDLSMLTTLARMTPRERLNSIFTPGNTRSYNTFVHAMVMADIRYIDVISPADAWNLILPRRSMMTNAEFLAISRVLARNAMATTKPALAAQVLDKACDLPEADEALAEEMAMAFRWSNQPLNGSTKLRRWMQTHARNASPKTLSTMSHLAADLALEGGSASAALDVALDALKRSAIDKSPQRAWLERAETFANQCNRMHELKPWIEHFAASLAESRLDIKQLHKLSSAGSTDTSDYRHWLTLLARSADWSSNFDAAFEFHLRLAALGEQDSLVRIVALSDFLGRDEETVTVLDLIGDVKGHPEFRLKHAEMLASLGRDSDAMPLYQAWLKEHPNDRDIAYSLACLYEDEGDEDATLAAFESLLKLHPGDVPSVKKLAENYIRANRHGDALHLYETLAEQDHDHYTLENYSMLAESLDDHEALLTAQLLVARRVKTPEAWLDIAETAGYLKDPARAFAALEEGLKSQPASASLRLTLSQLHLAAGRDEDALAVLMHECVRTSQPAVEALLDLGSESHEVAAVLRLVGDDVETKFPLSMQARLDLAVLCFHGNNEARAEALFKTVPETADNLVAVAEARYETGSFDSAAESMKNYLKDNPRAASDDWVFLGDIYDAMGRDEEAKRAYLTSLTLLTSDLPASKTTSSLTWPAKQPSHPTP